MKFLILTQYYPPETGAPQNRLHSLAINLVKNGCDVEVLTAMPNYPKMEIFKEYKKLKSVHEKIDDINVYRTKIYVNKKKGIFNRLLNYFSFVLSSMIYAKKLCQKNYVICESPPLFLGISALYISKILNAKLIFNVSDLWPESAEKLNIINNKFLLKPAYALERYIYNKSFLVTCQTKGIEKNIINRFPNLITHWLPNGIDKNVYNVSTTKKWLKKYGLEGKRLYVYAGIIGYAQGLEVIIRAKHWLIKNEYELSKEIEFLIIGDGPEKSNLLSLNNELKTKIIFIPNTPKIELIQMLKSCDVYIVPLKKIDIFNGAIPSKIFDALALSIPLLLGVNGEAKSLFIDEANAGLHFEPEDPESLAKAVIELEDNPAICEAYGKSGNIFAHKYFDRKIIASQFIEKVKKLMI